MSHSSWRERAFRSALLCIALVGCGGEDERVSPALQNSEPAPLLPNGPAAIPGAPGADPNQDLFGDESSLDVDDAPAEGAAEQPAMECAAFNASATASPVDVALLLDRSGSMAGRWEPLMEALNAFLAQLNPQGRLALQVFPDAASTPMQPQNNGLARLQNNGICGDCSGGDCLPQSCTSDADCGGASCDQEFGVCTCVSDQECGAGVICHRSWCDRGNLTIDLKMPPLQVPLCGGTTLCEGGAPCRSYGELNRATVSMQPPEQDPKVYEVPVVPFTLDHAEVITSLAALGIGGGTPMAEALEGFSKYLDVDRAANPTRKSVLVLVSDGLPNGEDGLSRSVASVEQLREQGMDTYLIGITSAPSGPNGAPTGAEEVSEGLKQLAAAGSELEAFLVEDGTETLEELKKTLGEVVAAAAIQCEFVLPVAADGRKLDLDKVSLKVTEAAAVSEVPFVIDELDCDPLNPGWHFDALPPVVEVPSAVKLCPALCDKLTQSTSVSLEFSVSCEAVRPPPLARIR